jgi:hypothetical protein
LSQASTSPWRWMNVALGCRLMISLGRAPFGPVSAEVVRMVGRSKRFPIAAWAMMLWRNSTVL